MIAAFLVSVAVLAGPQGPDEPGLRAAVQRFYDAQASKDLAGTVACWSAAAPDRPTNGTYQAIFDTGEDQFTVDIKELVIVGSGARLRVLVKRVRTAHEQDRDRVYRGEVLNNQQWRYEGGAWKLVRDRSAADDFADVLFAANEDQWPALLGAQPDLVNQALRYAVAGRASGRAVAQQYREALAGFRLALAISRALHDRSAEIESLQNVASAHYFLKDFANAADAYTSALAVARDADAPEQIAAAQIGLGTVAYSRGDYSAALAAYEAARTIYDARDEGTSIGRATVSIGNVQYLQGEYDAAAGSYRRALELLTKGMDFPGASLARSGLGRVFATQGDLSSALQAYTEVLDDTRARPTPGQKAATLESIGEIHYRLGNVNDARARFGDAVRFYDLVQATADVARVYGDLGLTELSAGRADAALAAYVTSREQYGRAKRPDGVAHAWVGIGFSQAAARKFDEAIAAYRTAITMLDEQQRAEDSARAWLGLSMAQRGSGARDAALASARHVRAAADALNSDELRWRAAVEEGTTLRALGRLDDARASLESAIAIIEGLAPGAPTSADVRGALDGSAAAWTELAFTLAQAQDAAGAALAAERRHAHARRLMLAPFERDITIGMTTDEQRDEQQVARDLVSTRAQLRAERAAPRPDAARVSRLEEQLLRLSAERTERQAALYSRLPDLRTWRATALPTDLNSVAVPDGSVLIEYLVGDDDLLVTWLAGGPDRVVPGAAVVPVTRQALAEAVEKATDPAALKDAQVWGRRSAPLSDAVLAPAKAVLDGRDTCVIVPDDRLWRVPFEALPIEDGDLASRMTVAYATSFVSSARHAAAPSAVTTHPSLAVIAPTLAPAIRDTETAAREAIGSAAVTTIVAPVEMSGAAPLFSSVLFAPSGDTLASDGRLEVREWFGLHSEGGIVVMPDARSFDRQGIGAGMEALDWATAAAGVAALFVGRAPADAFTVEALARALHAHLSRGDRPGAAWRAAIADVRATAGSAPAAWAGLRLLGSPR